MLWLLEDILLQIPQIIFSTEGREDAFSHLYLLSNISSPSQQTDYNKTSFLLYKKTKKRDGLHMYTDLVGFWRP